MHELVEVELPDGQVIWADVRPETGPRDVGLGQRLKLDGLSEVLRAVATNVQDGVRAVRPDELTVEFGVELAVTPQGLVAALSGASGKATVAVTMKWQSRTAGSGDAGASEAG